jgi:capsular polysaccharide biosynthesis protein
MMNKLLLLMHACCYLQIVDTAKMKFEDQLKLIRGTNVLVGIHGAGLMFIMFAAEEVTFPSLLPCCL